MGGRGCILTMNQALTLMANIPIFTVVDSDPFVFTEASLDLEMRVAASQEDNSSLKSNVETEAKFKIGGIAAIFGGGGSVRVKQTQRIRRRRGGSLITLRMSRRTSRWNGWIRRKGYS